MLFVFAWLTRRLCEVSDLTIGGWYRGRLLESFVFKLRYSVNRKESNNIQSKYD